MSDTKISDAALPVVARYVGRTSNIYRYIAEDLAVVDAQIADEAKKPESVRLRDELRERAEFETWAEKRGHDLSVTRDHPIFIDGVYENGDTCNAWTTWQAALAATGKQQVGEVQGDGLLPCPFCGNTAEFVPYKTDGLTLKCTSLGCVQRNQRSLRYGIDSLRASMKKHWNLRALAARQPVGQEPVVTTEMLAAADAYHDSEEFRSGQFGDDHTNAACYRVMAAAAPHAQSVDMNILKLSRIIASYACSIEISAGMRAKCIRLLALIEEAVQ